MGMKRSRTMMSEHDNVAEDVAEGDDVARG